LHGAARRTANSAAGQSRGSAFRHHAS
jgi:hypothetical protein